MHADVLIIGAGPVGLTAAHLLSRHGLRVQVLERRLAACREPRAVSLDDEGLRIWQACGLAHLLRDDWGGGDEGQRICTYLDRCGRAFLRLHQRTSELGHPHAVAIHQGRIEQKLLSAAEADPSIHVQLGHTVERVEQRETEVAVHGVSADGTPFAATASWAIACDGGGGMVRRQLGIAWIGAELERAWLIANVVDPGQPGHVTIRCAASSAAVTMPLPHGLRRIEVELPEGDDGAWLDDEAEVRRRLRRGWAGAAHAPIVGVSRRRFKAVVAERWRSGRIFLAGDAAHLMPPFAGQGLCAGLRDAANLSFKIAGAHQGWLSPEVLDTYEEERRPHVDRMTRLACRLGRVMSPRTAGEGALVHGALRAIGRAPAVASRWLLRGPRIQPALASGMFVPCGSAGRYLPQPMVAAADGRRVPLDELLGSRLTWVILEGFVSKGPIPERAVQSSLREALLAWHEESRSRREPPTVDACDTVLLEGRDFHDPEQVLRRRYGAGSLVLVRPDRVVHAHIPQSWLRPFLRRRFACRFDAGAARGAPSQVRWSWRRAPVAWPTAPTRAS